MNSGAEERQAGARPRRGRAFPVAPGLPRGGCTGAASVLASVFAFQGATAVKLHADAPFPRAEGQMGSAVLAARLEAGPDIKVVSAQLGHS